MSTNCLLMKSDCGWEKQSGEPWGGFLSCIWIPAVIRETHSSTMTFLLVKFTCFVCQDAKKRENSASKTVAPHREWHDHLSVSMCEVCWDRAPTSNSLKNVCVMFEELQSCGALWLTSSFIAGMMILALLGSCVLCDWDDDESSPGEKRHARVTPKSPKDPGAPGTRCEENQNTQDCVPACAPSHVLCPSCPQLVLSSLICTKQWFWIWDCRRSSNKIVLQKRLFSGRSGLCSFAHKRLYRGLSCGSPLRLSSWDRPSKRRSSDFAGQVAHLVQPVVWKVLAVLAVAVLILYWCWRCNNRCVVLIVRWIWGWTRRCTSRVSPRLVSAQICSDWILPRAIVLLSGSVFQVLQNAVLK